MGLLQDPIKVLDQAGWYLDNAHLESFPGAFHLAAGSLCRQTLEQILFLLCFFSRMPQRKYMRQDRTLQVAGRLLQGLEEVDASSGRRYIALARRAGPRVRKLARHPTSLSRWQRELNEPAHFSLRMRTVDETRLREFVRFARTVLDENDKYAIVAAINEIFSNGTYRAVLGDGPQNMPGVTRTIVVGPGAIKRGEDGSLGFKTPSFPIRIISATEVPRGRWPRGAAVIVQHTVGMSIGGQLVTKRGDPVDLTSIGSVIASFAKSEGQRRYLKGHLRRLGFEIEWRRAA